MAKITKRTVDASAPDPARRYYVWDDRITGFGLLVLPSGVKSYIYRYRTAEGRERRATIGKHGEWTADQARERADQMRQARKEGRDPLDEKATARAALTVNDVLDRYLASARFSEKAPSTQAIDRGRIERHLRPLLGRSFVDRLRPEDVRRALADITVGKTAAKVKTKKRGLARVTGGTTTARDTIGLLRAILNWALSEDLTAANPAAAVKLPSVGRRETFLEGKDDYARLFTTLDRMQAEKRLRAPVAEAIRVIALTGARRGEIAGLTWGQVDLKAGRLVIPPAGHKSGRRTGKPRVIELPAAAQTIIARQPGGDHNDYVFPPALSGQGRRARKAGTVAEKPAGPVDLSHPWRTIRVEAQLPEGIGLHGLRHSLASHMAMAGAQAAEIQAAMGHATIAMSARYVHWATDAQRKLAERAASVALAGLAKASGDESADVVSLPGAGK